MTTEPTFNSAKTTRGSYPLSTQNAGNSLANLTYKNRRGRACSTRENKNGRRMRRPYEIDHHKIYENQYTPREEDFAGFLYA